VLEVRVLQRQTPEDQTVLILYSVLLPLQAAAAVLVTMLEELVLLVVLAVVAQFTVN
jgi:hypothetical protein